jgi:hypothetical protein
MILVRALIIGGLACCVGVGLAAPANATVRQDQEFYHLVTEDGWPISNFPLVRANAILTCQREDAGEPPYRALKDLETPNGPYTFDQANSVTSAAETIYCPWHSAPPGNQDSSWVNTSAPVYPPPTYPPIEWIPLPTQTGGLG